MKRAAWISLGVDAGFIVLIAVAAYARLDPVPAILGWAATSLATIKTYAIRNGGGCVLRKGGPL